MATSLAFGVLFATGVILILVPVGYYILEDIKTQSARLWRWYWSSDDGEPDVPEEVAAEA